MASVGGFRVPGDCASRVREVGSGCVQQGGWRLNLGVHFLPTIGKRLRRECPGSWWGVPSSEHHQKFWASPHLGCRVCLQGGLEAQGLAQVPSASTSGWAPGRSWVTARRRAALAPDRSH